MIKAICDVCLQELNEFGGLFISPPRNGNEVTKYHACVLCWGILEDAMVEARNTSMALHKFAKETSE